MPAGKSRPRKDRRDAEIAELRAQLAEARETLEAIRSGAVDGVVVAGPEGERVFTLEGAEAPYRFLIEAISEGVLVLDRDGMIFYTNAPFAEMASRPFSEPLGMHWSRYFLPSDHTRLSELLASAEMRSVSDEFTLANNGATGRPVNLSVSPIRKNPAAYFAAIVTDCTERKRWEATLAAQADFARRVFDSSDAHQAVVGPDGRIVAVNEAWLRFGRSNQAGDESTWSFGADYFRNCISQPGGDPLAEAAYAGLRSVQQNLQPEFELEYPCDTPHGQRWFFLRVVPLQGRSGSILVSHIDITRRKRAERALKQANEALEQRVAERTASLAESEQRMDLAFRAAQDGIWDWNMETDEVFYSTRWKTMLGYGDEEVEHHVSAWKRLIHPDDLPRALEVVAGVMRGEREYVVEFRMRHKNGHYVNVLSRGFPVRRKPKGPIVRIVGTHLDLTERRRAEETLVASEQRFRQMALAISEVFWITTPAFDQILYVSPAVECLWGRPAEAILASPRLWLEAIHADDRPQIELALERLTQGHRYESEYRVVHPDGTTRWVRDRGYPILDAGGRVTMVTGVCSDITERKQMEAAIKASQDEKFRAIFDGASDGILLADMVSRRFVLANAAICQMLGYTAQELTALGVEDIHPQAELGWILEAFDRLSREELSSLPDLPVQRKDGRIIHVSVGTSVILLEGKRSIAGFFRDITERRQADAALKESEMRYRLLVDNLPVAVNVMDSSFQIVMANRAAARLLRAERPQDLIGRSAWEITGHPSDQPQLVNLAAELSQHGVNQLTEQQFRCLDGSKVDVEARAIALTAADGTPAGYLGIAEDITARKRAAAEAAARESIWRLFLEADSLEDTYQKLSEMLATQLGFPMAAVELYDPVRDEFTFAGVTGMKGISRGFRACASQMIAGTVARTNQPVSDCRASERMKNAPEALRRPGFETFLCVPFHDRGRVAGTLVLADFSVREDATEWVRNLESISQAFSLEISRRRAMNSLSASEARFRCYVEQASEALLVCDAEGRILDLNRQACLNSGYSREELLKRNVLDLLTGPSASQAASVLRQSKPGVPGTLIGESRRKDGTIYPIETAYVSFELDGEQRILSLSRDVTERMRGEQERLRLSKAIEQSGEAVVITDPLTRIQYVNSAFERNTGFTSEEVLGQTPHLLASGRHDHEFYRGMWESIHQDGVWRGRFTNRHKDGHLFLEDTTITAIRDPEGRVLNYVAVKRDVTREARVEEQLRQAQKLEAIGQLAGGVAHDFNNILAAVMMQVGMLQLKSSLDPEEQEILSDLQDTAQRGADLTRQMLLFSRRTAPALQPLHLNDVIASLIKMLRRLIRENVELQFEGAEDLPPIEADAGMLEQVLTNLVVNARDAMPSGGRVTIATTAEALREEDCLLNSSRRTGSFVRLSVADTGCGMDAETRKHIFEPFFTTKAVGEGTGLGLATVYGIVTQHLGWVELESQLGLGTTFHVFLPASGHSVSRKNKRASSQAPPGGMETILLVEDDPFVRQPLGQILRGLGYRVHEAANGEEALQNWPIIGPEVDLLFTDIVMPGSLDGKHLADRLRATKPGLKVILSSGYSTELHKAGRTDDPGIVVLTKPYEKEKLAKTIRRCLGRSAGSTAPEAESAEVTPADSGSLTPGAVASVPAALAGQIHNAALLGRYYRLLDLLEQVAAADATLADRLRPLVRDFDYTALTELFGNRRC